MDLKDKVVLITGASGGIGRAVALEFAGHGSLLSLTGRNETRLQETGQKCMAAGTDKANILFTTGNLTNEEEVKTIIEKTVEKYGKLDVLINNAGDYVLVQGFADVTVENMDSMYNVNVRGTFLFTKYALPHLLKTKDPQDLKCFQKRQYSAILCSKKGKAQMGSIVNVGSIAGSRPLHHYFPYAVAKAGINHMTQMLALEYGPQGVRVNCVTPGSIMIDTKTELSEALVDKQDQVEQMMSQFGACHPLEHRMGRVEEVARTIVFLSSASASFISGALVPIDGARHCTCSEAAYWNSPLKF